MDILNFSILGLEVDYDSIVKDGNLPILIFSGTVGLSKIRKEIESSNETEINFFDLVDLHKLEIAGYKLCVVSDSNDKTRYFIELMNFESYDGLETFKTSPGVLYAQSEKFKKEMVRLRLWNKSFGFHSYVKAVQ